AYAKGGALETVVGPDDPQGRPATGVFFHRQDEAALLAALEELESGRVGFDPAALAAHAAGFATPVFTRRILEFLVQALAGR
ncbi:MAG: glycosyltransferase family 4 protein, partial [Desulfarculus sp.]|nr:glycosyltransferase family 4 protein [Desulfarculus sp.]